MQTKEKQRGISLIVLIITILVVIILVAVVILTLSKNNPIESAKEARFKEDVRTFQDELAMSVSKQYANAGGHRDEKITTSDFDEIKSYIPSFSEKYRGKFVIKKDELIFTNKLNNKEKIYTQSLNINEINSIIPVEYQQVEYIESTGTQYIDTGIYYQIGTPNYKQIMISCAVINGSGSVWGVENAVGRNRLILYTDTNWRIITHTGNAGNKLIDTGIAVSNKNTTILLNENNLFIDNVKISLQNNLNAIITYTSEKSIPIFAKHNNNGYTCFNGVLRVYSFIIKSGDGSLVVRSMIPCYSTTTVTDVNGKNCPSGTKGMYDTVEGKFYTNQGDPTKGDFIAGPDV